MATLLVETSESIRSKISFQIHAPKQLFNSIKSIMDSSIGGPVMTSIVMTELENEIIKPFMNDGTQFY